MRLALLAATALGLVSTSLASAQTAPADRWHARAREIYEHAISIPTVQGRGQVPALAQYLQEQFPKKLTGMQIEKLQVLYEQMIQDDELMQELEEIIDYSAEHMKTAISNGTEIYEFVEGKLSIQPVGIMPLNSKEGYFLLSEGATHATRVYSYRISFFGDEIETIETLEISSNKRISVVDNAAIFPANLYLAPKDIMQQVIAEIQDETAAQVEYFKNSGKFIEAPHTGANVRISTLAGRTDFVGARRY